MPAPLMNQAMESCRAGEWRSAPKLYANPSSSGKNVYIQNSGGHNPSFITPVLKVAFELSAGKDKPIEEDSILNMELSVREDNPDCIEFGDAIDGFVHSTVSERIKELYPGMDPNFLRMLQRRAMAPKKEFKFAPQPPYAWRFKLGKLTTYLVVTATDADGREMCCQGTRDDVKPGCSVRVNGIFPKIYTSPASFGPNFEASVVLIYPNTGTRGKATAVDNFGFGDNLAITIVAPQAKDDADAATGDGTGGDGTGGDGTGGDGTGGDGTGGDGTGADSGNGNAAQTRGGAYEDTRDTGTDGSSGGDASGGNNGDASGDDAPSAKRGRNSDPYA